MAFTDSNGIVRFDDSDKVSPLHPVLNSLGQSVSDRFDASIGMYRADNLSDRNALVGFPLPTASNPLFVWRMDAPTGEQLEYTRNGIKWHFIATSESGGGGGGGGGSNGGGGGGAPSPDTPVGQDMRAPAAPLGLSITAEEYTDADGASKGRIEASWKPVTKSTEGSEMEIVEYGLWGRLNTLGTSWMLLTTTGPEAKATLKQLEPNESWLFRVRAQGEFAVKPGSWTPTVNVVIPADTTPPAVPEFSQSDVSTWLRAVNVQWSGKTSAGGNMPRDFSHVNVYQSTSSSLSGNTLVGSITDANGVWVTGSMPVDETVWYALTAVDRTGNESAFSVPYDITPTANVNVADIADKIDATQVEITVSGEELSDRLDSAFQSSSDASDAASAAQDAAEAADIAATSAETKASNAADAAADALADALAASGLAASKGEVIFQATAPTGTKAVKQNLWIRSSDNAPHTYNGTKWVLSTDKAATDAATAAGEAQTTASNAADAASTAQSKAEDAVTDASNAQDTADTAVTDASTAQSKADAAAIAAAAARAEAISRGNDLVTNGNGSLKDNTNFPAFTYVGSDSPTGTTGSFEGVGLTNEIIPVNVNNKYAASVWVRQTTPGVVAKFYLTIAPYDSDGLAIKTIQYMEQAGTRTKLAADLVAGQTVMEVLDASKWNNVVGAGNHLRNVIFWNYVDGSGKLWEPGTYSRNTKSNGYADGGISGNVITLREAHTGATIPAGTWVSNGSAGGTYMYPVSNLVAPEEWTFFPSPFLVGGIHTETYKSASTKFPIPTAGVRVGVLANRDAVGGVSVMRFAGFSLTDVTTNAEEVQEALDAAGTAQSRADAAHTLAGTAEGNAQSAITSASSAQTSANDAAQDAIDRANDAQAAAALDATAKADTAKSEATNAAAADATTKANKAKDDAEDAAAIYAETKASDAGDAALSAAKDDATTKANAAKDAAEVAAALDATAKADAAESAASTDASNKADQALADAKADAAAKVAQVAKNLFSTSAPAGSAPYGSTWFKVDSGGSVIGQWQQTATGIGSTWTVREIRSEVIANLDTGKLTAGSAAISTAVIDKLWVDVVQSREITTDMLKAGSITTPLIYAGAVTATEIESGTITAEEIHSNAITTDKIEAGAITSKHTITGALVQSNAAANRGVKFDDAGLRAYTPTGENTFTLSAATGEVTMKGDLTSGSTITGASFSTSENGARVEIGKYGGNPSILARDESEVPRFVLEAQPTGTVLEFAYPDGRTSLLVRDGDIQWFTKDSRAALSITTHILYDTVDGSQGVIEGPMASYTQPAVYLNTYDGNQAVVLTTAHTLPGSRHAWAEVTKNGTWHIGNEDSWVAGESDGTWLLGGAETNVSANVSGDWYLGNPKSFVYGYANGVWVIGSGNTYIEDTDQGYLNMVMKAGVLRFYNLRSTSGGSKLLLKTSSGGAPNVFFESSVRASKVGIIDVRTKPELLLDLSVREWVDRTDMEERKKALTANRDLRAGVIDELPDDIDDNLLQPLERYPGLIAEELEDAGLGQFCIYDGSGKLEGVMYDRIALLLIPLVRDMRDRIESLEGQNNGN